MCKQMVKNCSNCWQRIFWYCFSRVVTFYRSNFFKFVTRRSEIRLKFWASKWHFNGIQLLQIFSQNKSIFSQTKCAVIYLQLRPTLLGNMGKWKWFSSCYHQMFVRLIVHRFQLNYENFLIKSCSVMSLW